MKRKDALDLMRIAGYHDDQREFARLFCESRVSRSCALEAYETGVRQKDAGMKCGCFQCKNRTQYPLGYMQGNGAA